MHTLCCSLRLQHINAQLRQTKPSLVVLVYVQVTIRRVVTVACQAGSVLLAYVQVIVCHVVTVACQAGSVVLCEPEVRRVALPSKGARLIIASDGLWDAVNPKTAAHHVRGMQASKAANELVGPSTTPSCAAFVLCRTGDIDLYSVHELIGADTNTDCTCEASQEMMICTVYMSSLKPILTRIVLVKHHHATSYCTADHA